MPTGSKAQALARDARFVFIGTIQRLRAATMDDVPLDDRTAIVRVDQIVHAPDVLAQYTGHDITVRIGGRRRVQEGVQATFYTSGWLFGDSIAVESFDHQEVRNMAAAREAGDPVHRLRQKETQARFDDAPVVVSGRVTSVRMPSDVVAAAAVRARGAPQPSGPISEHDPDWRIADIQVDEVHKGSVPTDTVSVRFPSSQDVMWHDMPKFQPGEEGLFMLHRTPAGGKRAAARGVPANDAGEFVMPQRADFIPFSEPGAQSLIRSTAGGSATSAAEEEREGPSPKAPQTRSTRRKRTIRRRSAKSRKRGA
jgi:hypothetical protein